MSQLEKYTGSTVDPMVLHLIKVRASVLRRRRSAELGYVARHIDLMSLTGGQLASGGRQQQAEEGKR